MKFSFFMMPLHHPSENPSLAYQRDVSLIEYADDLDFDEFYIGEHHSGGWETMPAPEMALAMAAARAKRIRLGTSVISLPFHHPFHVAERMAFLDQLTRGRVILGVGPSNLASDIKLFDVPPGDLRPMMRESVDVIVRLLESPDPFDYEGRFWKLRDARLQVRSYQSPRMPLAIASAGSRGAIDLSAEYGMILLSFGGRKIQDNLALSEQWPYMEECARRRGARVSRENWRITTHLHLAESREKAWAEVEEAAMRDMNYFMDIGLKPAYEAYPDQPRSEITPRSAAEQRYWIVGTPDDAIETIEKMREETGGFGGLMLTTHEWASDQKTRASLELFARHVMPHFRGHTQDLKAEWSRLRKDAAEGKMSPQGGTPSWETPGREGHRSNLFTYPPEPGDFPKRAEESG